jgi:hypothetical protein
MSLLLIQPLLHRLKVQLVCSGNNPSNSDSLGAMLLGTAVAAAL